MNEKIKAIEETLKIETYDWLNDRAKYAKISIGEMIDTLVEGFRREDEQRKEEERKAALRSRLLERVEKIEAFIDGLKSL